MVTTGLALFFEDAFYDFKSLIDFYLGHKIDRFHYDHV